MSERGVHRAAGDAGGEAEDHPWARGERRKLHEMAASEGAYRPVVARQAQKQTGGTLSERPPVRRAGISAYFKLSSVRSKASFATTVEPHQLDWRPGCCVMR
jgi:hypothetical protein